MLHVMWCASLWCCVVVCFVPLVASQEMESVFSSSSWPPSTTSASSAVSKSSTGSQKLLVILVDGVRYDYLNNDSTLVGFKRMAKNGVRAEYVMPTFPPNSYPNWYTIATGLYAESHGFVQNYMYDEMEQDMFMMYPHPNASHPHWWNTAEPLWITAEKHNIHSALYWWDGCQVEIRGKKPTFCVEYENYWTWPHVERDTEEALMELIEKFEKDEYRLGMLYYEAVDANGHAWGPEAEETLEAVRDIDSLLNKLQDEIEKRNLEDQVNIMVVSDHGMISSEDHRIKVINIEQYINPEDVQLMLDRGSMSMILPREGKEEMIYQALSNAKIQGLRVYKKQEIPERYHYRSSRRILPILLVAEKGYYIQGLPDPRKMKPYGSRIFRGNHGYDPYEVKEMRTILYARGPAFRKGYVAPPLQMVDHYNIMCHVLHIDPLPNNGSWSRVKNMLVQESSEQLQSITLARENASAAHILRHPTIPLYSLAALLVLLFRSFNLIST